MSMMAKYSLTMLLVCGASGICARVSLPQVENSARERSEEFEAETRQARTQLARAAKLINSNRLDFESVIRHTGSDPRDIANWVRENTSLLLYEGALKGAHGTLMERRGNSLDRSLLLIELLQRAGHKAKLQRTDLSEAGRQVVQQAFESALMEEARVPSLQNAQSTVGQNDEELIQRLAQVTTANRDDIIQVMAEQRDAERAIENLRLEAIEQAKFLVGKSGLEDATDDRALLSVWEGSGSQHWSVVTEIDSEAIEYDLVFGTEEDSLVEQGYATAPPKMLSASETISSHGHKVTVRVLAHRELASGEKSTHVALQYEMSTVKQGLSPLWLGFVALAGQDVALDKPIRSMAKLNERLVSQREWLPVIWNDGQPIVQYSIRADGTVNKEPTPASGVGQIASATTDAFGGFAAALEGLGTSKSPEGGQQSEWSELSGVSIEFITDFKSGTERTIRKLFDIENPSELHRDIELRARRSAHFLSKQQFLIHSHDIAPDYQIYQQIKRGLTATDIVSKIIHEQESGNANAYEDVLSKIDPPAALITTFSALRRVLHGDKIALTQANLVGQYIEVLVGSQEVRGRLGIDIIQNRVTGLDADSRARFKRSVEQGVFDTLLEEYLIGSEESSSNAAAQLRMDLSVDGAARWISVPTAHAQAEPPPGLSNIDMPPERVLIYSVQSQSGSGAVPTYWLIDPHTGNTLGYASDGRGSDMIEFAIVVGHYIFKVYSLVMQLGSCGVAVGYGDSAAVCNCVVSSLANVYGFGFAKMMGAIHKGLPPARAGKLISDKTLANALNGLFSNGASELFSRAACRPIGDGSSATGASPNASESSGSDFGQSVPGDDLVDYGDEPGTGGVPGTDGEDPSIDAPEESSGPDFGQSGPGDDLADYGDEPGNGGVPDTDGEDPSIDAPETSGPDLGQSVDYGDDSGNDGVPDLRALPIGPDDDPSDNGSTGSMDGQIDER